MYVSHTDPQNSAGRWFTDRTLQATRPQDWTPEADLFLDYKQHATACGIKLKDQLGIRAFSRELRAICRREPRKSMVSLVEGGPGTLTYFWPRIIRRARVLKAA